MQVIGEAASRLPTSTIEEHPEIPWSEIVGMRHILVHDYMAVDLDVVWEVVTIQLPGLVASLEAILKTESGPSE